jgi:hypothetical protein
MRVPKARRSQSSNIGDGFFKPNILETHILPTGRMASFTKITIEIYPFSASIIAISASFQFIICSYEEISPDRNVAA